MSTPHAVISGMSIAGLSTAFWLRRIGWEVTLIERAHAFRDGGQNVDVRGVAHDVLDRMGLTDVVVAHHTTETGTVFVDDTGQVIAELPSDGADGATTELEVLRGDFARVLFDALPADTDILYGTTIEHVDDRGDEVTVTTTAGTTLSANLLVVAEGVRSTTRDQLFGGLVDRKPLGVTMVFGTIPRTAADDDRWRWYNASGGRQVHLRPDNHGTTRAILANTSSENLTDLDHAGALAQTRSRFHDAGWETNRVLDAFDTADDVYIDDLTQIRMTTWHHGRVCLVGDAAWSITPLGGGGASLALTSGYVLAAYVSTTGTESVEAALADYETWMRPVVEEAQKPLPPAVRRFAYPQTALGLKARNLISKAVTSPPIKPLIARRMTEIADTTQQLPRLLTRVDRSTT